MTASIQSRPFGVTGSGEAVEAWTLRGAGGMELEALTYGCIVRRLLVPDAGGEREDVVLGFHDMEGYLKGHPYFGAIVGRVAGRIPAGRVAVNGRTWELTVNEAPNHLHGGEQGFDKRVWAAEVAARPDGWPSVRFRLTSLDGDQGYPGTLHCAVTYTVTPDNAFVIESEATAEDFAPVCLTHHSYFHLGGEGSGSIEEHELEVEADSFVPNDKDFTPLDRLEAVEDSANDFRRPRRCGDAIPQMHRQHGAFFMVRRNGEGDLVRAARLEHPTSGRVLEVFTTEKYMQFYTGAFLDGALTGKSGRRYEAFGGLCLECQGYSNGANAPWMGDIVLEPGETSRQKTMYVFSTSRTAQ